MKITSVAWVLALLSPSFGADVDPPRGARAERQLRGLQADHPHHDLGGAGGAGGPDLSNLGGAGPGGSATDETLPDLGLSDAPATAGPDPDAAATGADLDAIDQGGSASPGGSATDETPSGSHHGAPPGAPGEPGSEQPNRPQLPPGYDCIPAGLNPGFLALIVGATPPFGCVQAAVEFMTANPCCEGLVCDEASGECVLPGGSSGTVLTELQPGEGARRRGTSCATEDQGCFTDVVFGQGNCCPGLACWYGAETCGPVSELVDECLDARDTDIPCNNAAISCCAGFECRDDGACVEAGTARGDPEPVDVIEEEDFHPLPENDCTVTLREYLLIPKYIDGNGNGDEEDHRLLGEGQDDSDDGEDDSHWEWECFFPNGMMATIGGLNETQLSDLAIAENAGLIVSGESRIDLGAPGITRVGSAVILPSGFDVVQNAHTGGGDIAGAVTETERRSRRLAQLTGNKYTLVVKGRFGDYPFAGKSAAQISDDVFGTDGDAITLTSQLYACSFGQLVTIPGPDPDWQEGAYTSIEGIQAAVGVLEVDMGVDLADIGSETDIFNLFVEKTIDKLDPTRTIIDSLPGPFDHIIFAREDCLRCGWAAYANVNAWGQMFHSEHISQAGVLVHEMGHNLNLAHSGAKSIPWSGGITGNGEYRDWTCAMGNPHFHDDRGEMCFNPAKNYQIVGWYEGEGAKLTIDPMTDGPWEGNIVGVGEYDLRSNEPITIKIETGTPQDIFVGFNRATGPNRQNKIGDDQVSVTQVAGNDGVGYSTSWLLGLLDGGDEYADMSITDIFDHELKIRVNSIDTSVTPGLANVRIGFDPCQTAQSCQANSGQCFVPSCVEQGTEGADAIGCLATPIHCCCGNGICEGGETGESCAADCLRPSTIQPDDSGGTYRHGIMFDFEANAALSITSVVFKSATSYYHFRLYYRPGGISGYASGQNLSNSGWIEAARVPTCGYNKFCTISGLSIPVDPGARVGILVTNDGGRGIRYNSDINAVSTLGEFATVHPGTAFYYDQTGEYARSFVRNKMFTGSVLYTADVADESLPHCTQSPSWQPSVYPSDVPSLSSRPSSSAIPSGVPSSSSGPSASAHPSGAPSSSLRPSQLAIQLRPGGTFSKEGNRRACAWDRCPSANFAWDVGSGCRCIGGLNNCYFDGEPMTVVNFDRAVLATVADADTNKYELVAEDSTTALALGEGKDVASGGNCFDDPLRAGFRVDLTGTGYVFAEGSTVRLTGWSAKMRLKVDGNEIYSGGNHGFGGGYTRQVTVGGTLLEANCGGWGGHCISTLYVKRRV